MDHAIRRVGVIGAGQMGAGIASAHARAGIPSVMIDVDDSRLQAGLNRARGMLDRLVKTGEATPEEVAGMMGRIAVSTDRQALADADVVIEAITEDEPAKTAMYRSLAGIVSESAVLASNTSTIPIGRMAKSAPEPRRFAGMHFFHPVDRMKLIEIIRGGSTDDETVATLADLAGRLGKTAIVVNDCPGFLVSRLLFHYLREALYLLREGASMDAIDRAALKYGMPMGPVALMDLIGLDTVSAIFKVMAEGYPGRAEPSPLLTELVRAGRLGRKTGEGFRAFDGRMAPPKAEPESTADESRMIDRLFLVMALEATRVLDEGIVREPGDVDLGLLLGLGFPADRGGLLRWCDSLGAREVLARVERLEPLGARFRPTERLKRMAETGETFYTRK
jgi:3-hydroxyacyl-CoA dehydrogenase/enoyl-CoA hydratase/3-hydroxybutyryl-CoA epimerase/3-hydroxyacyl-CoA dehydrogenase/enoyl-CoA hydratase/3-hydroxybutyryl-CoA epimerase/enoyl-CoA isomerase